MIWKEKQIQHQMFVKKMAKIQNENILVSNKILLKIILKIKFKSSLLQDMACRKTGIKTLPDWINDDPDFWNNMAKIGLQKNLYMNYCYNLQVSTDLSLATKWTRENLP